MNELWMGSRIILLSCSDRLRLMDASIFQDKIPFAISDLKAYVAVKSSPLLCKIEAIWRRWKLL